MHNSRKVSLAEQRQLAAALAADVQVTHKELFSVAPVKASAVAGRLGLSLELRHDLVELGRFFGGDRISVKRGLSSAIGRFVVAHEIGHAVLHQRRPDLALNWSRRASEVFADAFAAELLFPPALRMACRDEVREAASPSALLKIANQFGVTPSCLLDFVSSQDGWLSGVSRIWLRIKLSPNMRRGGDVKLRIVSVHADPMKVFLAKNRSAERVLPDISFGSLPIGVDVFLGRSSAVVSVKQTSHPLYKSTAIPVDIYCVHLHSSFKDERSYYLVLLQMLQS